ncbi:hypothetical protein E8E11_001106 [Didymella keratinophila]|nr:hypothetical protein E8E11_001106 [Didymella keratinophila]
MMLTFGILSEQLYKWDFPTEYVLNAMGGTLFRLAMDGKSVTNLTVLSAPNGIFSQPHTFQVRHTHEIIFYKSDYK